MFALPTQEEKQKGEQLCINTNWHSNLVMLVTLGNTSFVITLLT